MKPFLIVGHPADLHAHYVAWALGTAGYDTTFINSSHDNCPTRATLYIDNVRDDFTSADWNAAEAAWFRRLSLPAEFDKSHREKADKFTLIEEQRFTKWLVQVLDKCSVRCINSATSAQLAENKFIQLKFAKAYGIRIPRTLVTAQPGHFRTFLQTEGVVVAKPLDGYVWEDASGEARSAFASVLDVERGSQLSDEDIAQCVTIYQERIDKVFDVRMVVMGRDIFAYKILQEGEQHFDFRIGFYKENHLRYEPVDIPVELKTKVINLMEAMKINFVSADFVLTADGEFVFLDLNPNGQWLFIETGRPEADVGQKFCSFFVEGSVNPCAEDLFPSYSEYTESEAAKALHEAFRSLSATEASPINNWKEREA
jgi:glutathione synthase/RimK-type ligase-like ATP-grasp enzyme